MEQAGKLTDGEIGGIFRKVLRCAGGKGEKASKITSGFLE